MTYYTQNTGHGSLNISELVFIQSAQRVLQELSVGQLKDRILLKSGKKTCKRQYFLESGGYYFGFT